MSAARWAVLLFALTFPTLMTHFYFSRPGPQMAAAYSAGKAIQFATPLLWWIIAERSRLRWPRWRRDGIPAGAAFGLLVAAGAAALYGGILADHPALARLTAEVSLRSASFGLTSPARFLLFAVFLSLVHALLEEYYWRAFICAELRRDMPAAAAIAVSSLGFMAHHLVLLLAYFPDHVWTLAVPLSLAVGAGGAVWAWLYLRARNIYAVWLSHALVDTALMGIGFHLLRSAW